ncbi:MAG TPA: Crp/Fnr family transcriptional regulator, partial [Pyrinomonadaceae bacterium]|nr:Crp/Fnr family transcriptional regulator [Pyrinomonadaceae bacterium]
MTVAQPQTDNLILAALAADERERLAGGAQMVSLELTQVLFRPGDDIRHVYFLLNCIVSLLTELEDGGGMEVGLVGREGMVGISVILGGDETKVATVQASGAAWRVSAELVREEFRRGGKFQRLVLRYTHALMAQISQSVVCNARHVIPNRLARWLLMYNDRLSRDEFMLTHEFMSAMLGVRRS